MQSNARYRMLGDELRVHAREPSHYPPLGKAVAPKRCYSSGLQPCVYGVSEVVEIGL
jgi:hypothetical protein